MAQPAAGNFNVRTRTFLLVPLRVFLGVVLLLQVYNQWDNNWIRAEGLREQWQSKVDLMFSPVLQDLLRQYVLPNSHTAAAVIMFVEILVAMGLIIGLYVRLASLAGALVTGLQLMVLGVGHRTLSAEGVAQGFQYHMPEVALYGLMFLVLLVFLLTGAGKSFGLDGMIWRRRARRLAKPVEQDDEPPSQLL